MSGSSKSASPAQTLRFRPDMERLEQREAPAAISLIDFYNVRSGRTLNQTRPNRNGVAGVLRNDYDDTQGTPPPFRNGGMTAALTSVPIDFATGIAITTPFTFQANGGFTFRAPRNFNGVVGFTYRATAADGSVSAVTNAIINVQGPVRRLAVGADQGSSPSVAVYNSSSTNLLFQIEAFDASFTGGVRVATGDLNADNTDDIVAGAGPSQGGHVKVFNGRTGAEMASFFAFQGYLGGVEVATGDLNGDDIDDLIVASGNGPAAHVKVFDGTRVTQGGFNSEDPANVLASFFAYGSGETGGIRVAAGDIDGDGVIKLVTAPASGGTLVKVFDLSGGTPVQTKAFFAGDPGDTRGLFVTAGDFNGDFLDDIAVGSGSGRPEARIYITAAGNPSTMIFERGVSAASFTDDFVADAFSNPLQQNPIPNFLDSTMTSPAQTPTDFAGRAVTNRPGSAQGFTGGLRVAVDYSNRDNFADLVIAQGPNGFPRVQILSGRDLTPLFEFTVFNGFFGGLYVGGHY